MKRPRLRQFLRTDLAGIICTVPADTYLKLLQPNTTPTIFFPISWTSPFTVASTIVPT